MSKLTSVGPTSMDDWSFPGGSGGVPEDVGCGEFGEAGWKDHVVERSLNSEDLPTA